MQYFDYAPVTTDRRDNIEYKAIAFIQNFSSLDILLTDTVQDNEQFRPDKISYRLYGQPDFDWVLNITNGFDHGFKEYTIGKTFKYPRESDLNKILNI